MEVGRAMQQALPTLAVARPLLVAAAAPTRADVESQLAVLLPAGFASTTPADRLRDLPRYLKAIQQRLAKAVQDPARDARLLRDVAPFETKLREAMASAAKSGGELTPAREAFRWLLQEYRVSLFAQQLGTAVPVSAQRLTQAWATEAT
jgi:ATP-dependent helicase HrpA